jgi:hypothetical protein
LTQKKKKKKKKKKLGFFKLKIVGPEKGILAKRPTPMLSSVFSYF